MCICCVLFLKKKQGIEMDRLICRIFRWYKSGIIFASTCRFLVAIAGTEGVRAVLHHLT